MTLTAGLIFLALFGLGFHALLDRLEATGRHARARATLGFLVPVGVLWLCAREAEYDALTWCVLIVCYWMAAWLPVLLRG